MSHYLPSKLDLTVEIDGTRFPCTGAHLNYALNTIPTARCDLVSGREASSGRRAAIHDGLRMSGAILPAKVIFKADGYYTPTQRWPNEEVVIFDGYAVGAGYNRTGNSLRPSISLIHWLTDLDFGSVLSANTHLQSISQYSYPAALQPAFSGKTGLKNPVLAYYQFGSVVKPELVYLDTWGKVFKAVFGATSQQEPLKLSGTISNCFGGSYSNQEVVRAALKRIEGVTDIDPDIDLAPSSYTPPLTFDSNKVGQLSETVVSAITDFIGQTSVDALCGQTIWNLLVNHYGANMLFAVVPQPEKAFVIPFNPCYRYVHDRKILATEYAGVRVRANRDRPLRGIGIKCNTFWSTGTNIGSGSNNYNTEIGIGGCFAPQELEDINGLVKIINAPKWIEKLGSSGYDAGATSGVTTGLPVGSSTTPVSNFNPAANGHPDKLNKSDSFRAASEIADSYAQYIYLLESLRGRSLVLSGRLRFDIAPGSIVEVESASTVGRQDSLAEDIVGCVSGVGITLDAEGAQAGTTLQLIYPRTVVENDNDLASMPFHPLYTSNFRGAPLVDKLAF